MSAVAAPASPSLESLGTIPWPVLGAKPGVIVEAAPGKKIAFQQPDPAPRYCLAELVPLGGGHYRVVPRVIDEWLGFGDAARRKLGINLSEQTMRRLGRAGFIRLRQMSPSRYEFNWQSWLEHCAAVEADAEEFWERKADPKGPTNREKYLAAF